MLWWYNETAVGNCCLFSIFFWTMHHPHQRRFGNQSSWESVADSLTRIACPIPGPLYYHTIERKPLESPSHLQWKPRVVMMPTLSSLAAPEVVVMTTSGAASYDKVGIMTTPWFQFLSQHTRGPAMQSFWCIHSLQCIVSLCFSNKWSNFGINNSDYMVRKEG